MERRQALIHAMTFGAEKLFNAARYLICTRIEYGIDQWPAILLI